VPGAKKPHAAAAAELSLNRISNSAMKKTMRAMGENTAHRCHGVAETGVVKATWLAGMRHDSLR